jgi:hypothetical protein
MEMPPFTPNILLRATVRSSYAFKALAHQAGIEMQICDIISGFFHYPINMDELTEEQESSRGQKDGKFYNFNM